MTVYASGLLSVVRIPAAKILAASHYLKMLWIHARSVATKVVEVEARRDRTDEGFVREAVCVHTPLRSSAEIELPIPTNMTTNPNPAVGRCRDGYLGPEPLVYISLFGHLFGSGFHRPAVSWGTCNRRTKRTGRQG